MIGTSVLAAGAQINLVAHYIITMTHVRVGEIALDGEFFRDKTICTGANGKASGVFSVLVKRRRSFTTHGVLAGGGLRRRRHAPTSATMTASTRLK